MAIRRLNNSNFKAISEASDPGGLKNKQKFAIGNNAYRDRAIARWYQNGGDLFLKWVKRYYRTWSGEPLRWDDPFAEQLFSLIGNPWIVTLYAEKPAQVGWTEAIISFTAFIVAEIRSPMGFGVEKALKLGDIVGPRIRAAFDHCEPIQKLKGRYKESVGREDTDTKQRQLSVGGVPLTCFYASTVSGGKVDPSAHRDRQASSSISSFPADVMTCDEIELWISGALDIAKKRQEACTLPTKVFRAGSTPGQVGGIVDNLMASSKYLFQWQVKCPECGAASFLDAFGSLLQPVTSVDESGVEEQKYLDIRGRPLKWFCRDEKQPVETAYIGCRHCKAELAKKTISAGEFICRNTGVSMKELCDRAIQKQEPVNDAVAVRLPKLATALFDPVERIRILLATKNPADEVQQGLGKPVSIGGGRINLDFILGAVGKSLPLDSLDWEQKIIVGCDQGQAANFLVAVKYWLPLEYEDESDRWYRAIVQVLHFDQRSDGVVSLFGSIQSLVKEYKANMVGMDLKPEVARAGEFGRLHPPEENEDYPVFLFSQCALESGQKFRRVPQNIQGVETSVFRLDRTAGLDAIRDRFYNQRVILPEGLEYNPKDPNNFIYHLQTSEKLSDGKWVELPGEPDHYFHAFNLADMALLCWLHERPKAFVFGGLSR